LSVRSAQDFPGKMENRHSASHKNTCGINPAGGHQNQQCRTFLTGRRTAIPESNELLSYIYHEQAAPLACQ
ncbi:MAG: hypothetical protein IJU23_03585, partial [Proteobacteria bacterium]|nr:hypothetical protein [Pseudomonadota bacterium]